MTVQQRTDAQRDILSIRENPENPPVRDGDHIMHIGDRTINFGAGEKGKKISKMTTLALDCMQEALAERKATR